MTDVFLLIICLVMTQFYRNEQLLNLKKGNISLLDKKTTFYLFMDLVLNKEKKDEKEKKDQKDKKKDKQDQKKDKKEKKDEKEKKGKQDQKKDKKKDRKDKQKDFVEGN